MILSNFLTFHQACQSEWSPSFLPSFPTLPELRRMAAAPFEDFVNYDFDWSGPLKIRRFGHRCFQQLELVMYSLEHCKQPRLRGAAETQREYRRGSWSSKRSFELYISKDSGVVYFKRSWGRLRASRHLCLSVFYISFVRTTTGRADYVNITISLSRLQVVCVGWSRSTKETTNKGGLFFTTGDISDIKANNKYDWETSKLVSPILGAEMHMH